MTDSPDDVLVEDAICIGSGSCARLAPEWFVMNDDRGVAEVKPGDGVTGRDRARLDLAERTCPVGAIFLGHD